MRSFYVMKPSETTFKHVREAFKTKAIDSVLMAVRSVPASVHEPWWDSYDQDVKAIRRMKKYGTVYPVIVWQLQSLPNSHPLNTPESRIKEALKFVRDSGTESIVWDFEDYRVQTNGEKQNPVPKDFGKMCVNAGLSVIGGMPQNLSGGVYFDEGTYDGEGGWWNCFKYKVGKFFGGPEKLPGVWVERFDDPGPYIKEMNDCYGGFWIYSHVRYGQRVKSDHSKWYKNSDPIPLSWWKNLRRITQ